MKTISQYLSLVATFFMIWMNKSLLLINPFGYGYMTMAVDLREVCKDDIPSSSLAGRNPAMLNNDAQRNNDIFHLPRDTSTTGCSTIPRVILSGDFSCIFDD